MRIKLGVPLVGSENWHGGITYIEAIIRSLRTLPKDIEPEIYLIKDYASYDIHKEHGTLENLINGQILISNCDRTSLNSNVIHIKRFDEIVEYIDFIFPVNTNCLFGYSHATWVPDLQHKHLPDLFSKVDLENRERAFELIAHYADSVVFSSNASKHDFLSHYPYFKGRAEVVHFYSQFDKKIFNEEPELIVEKYKLPKKYIICCNQFWQHKNHDVLFKALSMVGYEVHLVCTGATVDYRNNEWFDTLKGLISRLGIESKVTILGFIPRNDQIQLIRNAICVVQPSLFEGWSTVLEDARALGKKAIVSDIDVHREQAIPNADYFSPKSSEELSVLIKKAHDEAGIQNDELQKIESIVSNIQDLQRIEAEKLISLAKDSIKDSTHETKLLQYLTSQSMLLNEEVNKKETVIKTITAENNRHMDELSKNIKHLENDLNTKDNEILLLKRESIKLDKNLKKENELLEIALIEKEKVIQQQAKILRFLRIPMYVYNKTKSVICNIVVRLKPLKMKFIHSYQRIKSKFRPKLGNLNQYAPRDVSLDQIHNEKIVLKSIPRVSIVTPSFNQAEFIGLTIDSVLNQAYPNLQYFVQDGGSKDGTVEVLKQYNDKLSGWVSEKDNGQSHAINLGFNKTDGEIMAWLNSDDLLLPNAISLVVDYFEKHPEVDVIYGNRILIDENGYEIGRWILPKHDSSVLSWVDYIPQETMFWRRSIWEKVGGIDEDFRFAMDWDLLVRFRDAGANFAHLPYMMGAFRIHESQKTSANINDVGMKEMDKIRKRLLGYVPGYMEINRSIAGFMSLHVIHDLIYIVKKRFLRG